MDNQPRRRQAQRELPLARYVFDKTGTSGQGIVALSVRVTALSQPIPPVESKRGRLVVEAQCYADALLEAVEEFGDVIVARRRVA
jgi:hypothetical protein